jgi:3-deoxy-D-manno-octulosonic acid kinase
MTVFQKHGRYRFGSTQGFTIAQVDLLLGYFRETAQKPEGVLNGRTGKHRMTLPGVGPVVIKQFCRGGVLRHVNRRTFLGPGKTRSQAEFELLLHARGIGVNAPVPVGFAVTGRLLYHAWLLTRELPEVEPLSNLSLSEPEAALSLVPLVAEQTLRLIRHRVLHVDLHPGNVLVDTRPVEKENKIYLIDFDKARISRSSPRSLARRYCRRWQRAVQKHGLPEALGRRFREEISREGEGRV